jgi:predicted amidohydrolase YtcJ
MKKLLLAIILISASLFAQSIPSADLIVTNAKVWTGDKTVPSAEAIAVIGDTIVAVGTTSDIERWRGASTDVLDAAGRLVVPGFNDAHVHFVDGSLQLTNVQLKDASSPEELAKRIGEYAKALRPGEWVLGGNWDDQAFAAPRLPTHADIDAVTPSTPVFVVRYDGHMALANSLAMKLAGITPKTKDVPGGVIVRDAKGVPTGALKDAAMNLVFKVVPPLTRERRLAVVREGLHYAASVGVTSVQDMNPSYDDVSAYAELADAGELTTRFYVAPLETQWMDQAKLGIHHSFGSRYLRM